MTLTAAFLVVAGFALGDPPKTPPAPPVAQQAPNAWDAHVEDLSALLAPILDGEKVPALAVAIFTKDTLLGVGAAGVRARVGTARVNASDRFHLGSCTKAITATLCATLVSEGKLKWDSTVGDVLGPTAKNGCAELNTEWSPVTLEELLQHRGGAPHQVPADEWSLAWNCKDSVLDCRRAFTERFLKRQLAHPRGKFVYSNQGYVVAGRMCEAVTGKDWETLVLERVCAPLGITTAGFGPPSKRGVAPLGHRPDGATDDADNPALLGPAGTMHMTVADWARFVAFHLRGVPQAGMTMSAPDFARQHATPEDNPHYALGWGVTERDWGGRVLTHSGSNNHWFCVAWATPEKGFGVVVACNQGGPTASKACDDAAVAVFKWRDEQQAKSRK
jgi:CubicO group peptidase (beta-lactamase class C family)